jgi:hypothetical protein
MIISLIGDKYGNRKGDSMKQFFFMILIASLICGCTSVKKVYTSEGKEAYSLNCSGSALSWSNCYERAEDLCGTKGYVVLNKNEESKFMQMGTQGVIWTERTMVIQCNE